jgi:hypothetical protein
MLQAVTVVQQMPANPIEFWVSDRGRLCQWATAENMGACFDHIILNDVV